MATYNSAQWTNSIALPAVNNASYQVDAEQVVTWFDYAFTGIETTGDIIILARVPRDIRTLISDLQSTACGAGVTITLSLQNAAVTLSGPIAISAISQNTYGNTLALGFGTVVAQSATIAVPPAQIGVGPDADLLIGTIGGGTANSTGKIVGCIKYSSLR